MTIIRGNSTSGESQIGEAFRVADRRLCALQGLREDMKCVPLWYRCCDRFAELYLVVRLWKEVRDLTTILKTTLFTADPSLAILVGEFLYKVERFEEAAECFGKAVEILNVPNQDIRIRALMGKLECLIAIQEDLYWKGRKTPSRMRKESEVFYSLICEDVSAVSDELQKALRSRLCKARFAMDQLAMRVKVRWVSAMLRRCNFGHPD